MNCLLEKMLQRPSVSVFAFGRRRFVSGALASTASLVAAVCGAGVLPVPSAIVGNAAPRYVVFDEDNDHFFKSPASFMDEAHLEAYVDQIAAGGKTTHVFFCPTGWRASFDSKVWEPIWTGLAEYPEDKIWFLYRNWAKNAKALCDKGIDPYQVFIRRCREKGVSPWLNPRMNDGHDGAVFGKQRPFRSTTFWREHLEYHFDPTCQTGSWTLHNLDYRHPEVREYALAMLRELFERYDADGVNLLGRGWFPAEVARASEPIFDGFITEISRMRDEWSARRGHRILLSTFAAATPERCREQGYDVARYLREGKLDWAVCSGSGVDLEAWRKEIAPRKDAVLLVHHPNVVGMGKGLPLFNPTAAELRGWADAVSLTDPDGYYLYNVEYHPETQFEICRGGLLPKDTAALARHYKPWAKGVSLPLKMDKPVALTVDVGTPEGRVSLLFGFADAAPHDIAVTVNGVRPVWEHEERVERHVFSENRRERETQPAFGYHGRRCLFPEGTVRRGGNTVEIAPREGYEMTFLELQLLPAENRM